MKPPFGTFHQIQPWESPLELLIVAPHPDDEIMGPGGRALLQKDAGVAAVIVTDGARGAGGKSEPGLAMCRLQESLHGLQQIGAKFGYFLGLSSQEVKDHPERAAQAITWAVELARPRTVVTTAPFEKHATHRATTRATISGLHATAHWGRLLGYSAWSSIPGDEGVENVDISDVLEQKLEALRCHHSQLKARPFDEAARCLHRAQAILETTTGAPSARFLEPYVDLSNLADPSGPTLEEWLRSRFDRWVKTLLE